MLFLNIIQKVQSKIPKIPFFQSLKFYKECIGSLTSFASKARFELNSTLARQ